MNNYEECLTTDNDSSFLYDFIKMMFVCGIGSIIASLFVSNHVWRPMIMSPEEIKETELELEEENKDIPYEERYPLSDSSEFADYEDISGSSGVSSEEEDEEKENEEEQEQEAEEENNEPQSDKGNTSEEDLMFELEKDEDSDAISSGELIEKPSDEEGQDKKQEADENNIKKVADEIINGMIETSVNTIKKEQLRRKRLMLKKKKEQYEQRLEHVHLMKIIEHTPLGNVLMYYDNNQKTFCYQGPKNIPFKYLETVARKYVKIFNCKPLYVNVSKELEKAENLVKQKQEKAAMKSEDKNQNKETNDNDVFATFKNYKQEDLDHKSDIQNIKRLVDDKNESKIVETLYKNKKEDKKSLLIPARTNRFTYKGSFDSSLFFKITKNKVKIDFATFKRIALSKGKNQA